MHQQVRRYTYIHVVQKLLLDQEDMLNFCRHLWDRFFADNCQSTAAALTYQTLFAVLPLLTFTYTIFNALAAFKTFGLQAERFILNNIVLKNVVMVKEYLRAFSAQALNLSLPTRCLKLADNDKHLCW